MNQWTTNRGSRYEPSFHAALQRIGVAIMDWDQVAPWIEAVLNGASDAKLDAEFPVRSASGQRILLTQPLAHIPPLRIAFKVETHSPGTICYCDADRR